MKAYKGFDKDLKCRDFQYEIGKEYEESKASLCSKGFHACKHPLDCFKYYPPAESRYCEVEIDDNGERSTDSKVCGKKIKIGAEIDILGLIKAAFEFVKIKCTNFKDGGNYSALNGGYRSALNGGYRSALNGGNYSALNGGDCSALNGGDCSALNGGGCSALNGGDYSALNGGDYSSLNGGNYSALNGGDRSALNGGYRSALNGGNYSALNGGDCSALNGGNYSVIYGGKDAEVKAKKSSVLALQYWFEDKLECIKFVEVDGVKIKEDTFYKLDKNGDFVEADIEQKMILKQL